MKMLYIECNMGAAGDMPCASGVSVVNIDNGFGAGYLANTINQMESISE